MSRAFDELEELVREMKSEYDDAAGRQQEKVEKLREHIAALREVLERG